MNNSNEKFYDIDIKYAPNQYPPRPRLIMPGVLSEILFVVPLSIIVFIISFLGLSYVILTYALWVVHMMQKSNDIWIESCRNGTTDYYCKEEYLNKYGFTSKNRYGILNIKHVENILKEQEKQKQQKLLEEHENAKKIIIDYLTNGDFSSSIPEDMSKHRDYVMQTSIVGKLYNIDNYSIIDFKLHDLIIQGKDDIFDCVTDRYGKRRFKYDTYFYDFETKTYNWEK